MIGNKIEFNFYADNIFLVNPDRDNNSYHYGKYLKLTGLILDKIRHKEEDYYLVQVDENNEINRPVIKVIPDSITKIIGGETV
jgi:hypothetical protein